MGLFDGIKTPASSGSLEADVRAGLAAIDDEDRRVFERVVKVGMDLARAREDVLRLVDTHTHLRGLMDSVQRLAATDPALARKILAEFGESLIPKDTPASDRDRARQILRDLGLSGGGGNVPL